MQTKAYLSVLLLFLASTCFAQSTQSLVGSWKIVSQKITQGDSTSVADLSTYDAIKVVSPTHVAYLSVSKTDSASTAFVAKITADKNQYTEQFELSSIRQLIGVKAIFKYRLENDKWYIKGGLTLNGVITEFDEAWERIK